MTRVHILLACYNGEKYLREQLDSLLHQTYTDFQIIARDDQSTDSTSDILQSYQHKYPNKLIIMPSKERLGTVGNFSALLTYSAADYLFFSDQDDVWHQDKLKHFLEVFKKEDPATPLLVYSDLEVVDEKLKTKHPSFWKYSGLKSESNFNRLLVQNIVTGCAMAINKSLRNLVQEIPQTALMHDWWLTLVASACGKMIPIKQSYVKYRQHGSNVIGASSSIKTKLQKNIKQETLALVHQAETFKQMFNSVLPQQIRDSLHIFIHGKSHSWLKRKWNFLKHGFFRKGILRNVFRFCLNKPY